VADTAVTVFAPSSTPLERIVAVAELVSPVSPSDIKDAKKGLEAAGKALGGRKGGIDTRAQNQAIGNKIRDEGGKVTGGFGGKETQFGSGKGSNFSDGSALDKNGDPFQVQTVDTNAAGNMTGREVDAARNIAERSQQPVACVAKEKC
jgi:hypothetical protein